MSILLFIVILVVLILVHEFGHFIVAKAFGVRVDEFGVGFPPKALRLFKKGETEYTLNWLPFGGFVRLYGEEIGSVEAGESDYARSFNAQKKYKQALILVAGVAFNVLAAWLLFITLFATGIPTALEEEKIATAQNVQVVISSVLPDSPAENAGIDAGSVLISIQAGEDRIDSLRPSELTAFITEHSDEALILNVREGDSERAITATPKTGLVAESPERAVLGISLTATGILSFPLHEAVLEGTYFTGEMTAAIATAISELLTGAFTLSADFSQIAGPVGIVGIVGDAAQTGIPTLLMLTAFISINLAIINLIPFPALDGGRLLFVLIEVVKGSPVSAKVAQSANAIGFVLLILLMLAVTYNDILRLIQ